MNSCKTNEFLKELKDKTNSNNSLITGIENDVRQIQPNVSNLVGYALSTNNNVIAMNTSLDNVETDIDSIKTDIDSIKTNIDTINNNVVDIGVTLGAKKVVFNGYLTDGTNNNLARQDYTSSPLIFYWQNPYNKPVYITRYNFSYQEANEPTTSELYHSTAWTTKIGLVNDSNDGFDSNYISYSNNMEWPHRESAKRTWCSNVNFWDWRYLLYDNNLEIEIGISKRFGHYIAGNINTSDYDTNPVGVVYGYYYDN